ncbi:MAG: hypothetical protein GEU99_19795 [Luteitalea sp.]|nr:hypothetical protein [Luteitalea sp.]
MVAIRLQEGETRPGCGSACSSPREPAPWFISAEGSTCLYASTCLLFGASSIGAAAALLRADAGNPPPLGRVMFSVELLLTSAARIAATNLRVVLWLLLGALLFAVPTVLVLVFNAFRLGWDLCTLAQIAPADAAIMLVYVPLEYTAFVHGAAAGLQIASRFFCLLFGLPLATGPPGPLVLIVRACGLVLAGAILEALAMYLRTVR